MPMAYPMMSAVAAEHIRDLRRDAAEARRAHEARRARRGAHHTGRTGARIRPPATA